MEALASQNSILEYWPRLQPWVLAFEETSTSHPSLDYNIICHVFKTAKTGAMEINWKLTPRWRVTIVFTSILTLFYLTYSKSKTSDSGYVWNDSTHKAPTQVKGITLRPNLEDGKFHWASVPQRYPVKSMKAVPNSKPGSIPRIQHKFEDESIADRALRLQRLELVKGNFTHAWKGYKDHAWLRDEVAPISGKAHDHFGGWAATLVDSLGINISLSSWTSLIIV